MILGVDWAEKLENERIDTSNTDSAQIEVIHDLNPNAQF